MAQKEIPSIKETVKVPEKEVSEKVAEKRISPIKETVKASEKRLKPPIRDLNGTYVIFHQSLIKG